LSFGLPPANVLEMPSQQPFRRIWEDGVRLMKPLQVWWVALGFLVARFVFKRQPVTDPVSRLRSMGGL